ncbi:MAG: phosphoglucomutase (alpha-D-glucose-1,6-bisphosphate-dependent) [Bacteroidota bacterium]|nr:phosphoglucomutase (alpha-D-glucose-1,6-bisphosphate-dependent) [Bacteroidota bacterium]
MQISPLAGKPAPPDMLVNIPQLIAAYYTDAPDPAIPAQRVVFGTSGHRGSSLTRTFNEAHILAITQSICLYRKAHQIDGPLFMGMDTHALSGPALDTALEVLAANGVQVRLAGTDEYTPTPVISHAIVTHNAGRKSGRADGIVLTPSHNPPHDGGFKYNPPQGGGAATDVTQWVEKKANELLTNGLRGVQRVSPENARRAATTQLHDYLNAYVADLGNVVDMDLIRDSGLHLGVDPMGGAGVHYWEPIAARYKLNLTVINPAVDPTFRFMPVDWDGQIRMDPSSAYAMQGLIARKDAFDIAFACDTDHDRHGIVTRSHGLLPPNHYLAVCAEYLFQHRPDWGSAAAVGKSVVTSQLLDRVAARMGRPLYETPVGFKWFAEGLLDGSLGLAVEESAGASFARRNGQVWTTDKDGFIPALLAAEITARTGHDPGQLYQDFTRTLGEPVTARVEAPATPAQQRTLATLAAGQVAGTELASEKITAILTQAPGNHAPIGGLKVTTQNGWFAARPSGTEAIYKIYGESFLGQEHLTQIMTQAQEMVDAALAKSPTSHPPTI